MMHGSLQQTYSLGKEVRMRAKQTAWVFVSVIGLTGCSAHSPFILTNTTDVNQLSATRYAPHSKGVYITRTSLPTTVKYEVLAQLEVGTVWYGSFDKVLDALADGARKLGADAVVDVKTWHQPAGWSWAAPHGSGKAVKIIEPTSVDFPSLAGNWK
jgi:hypothetical protein